MNKKLALLLVVTLVFTLLGCGADTESAPSVQLQDTVDTAPVTSLPTEAPTEVPTDAPTDAPTEVPTETPTEAPTTQPVEDPTESAARDYVLNTNSRKFHYPDCSSAAKIKDSNRKDFHGTREEVIQMGYEPCKNCNP